MDVNDNEMISHTQQRTNAPIEPTSFCGPPPPSFFFFFFKICCSHDKICLFLGWLTIKSFQLPLFHNHSHLVACFIHFVSLPHHLTLMIMMTMMTMMMILFTTFVGHMMDVRRRLKCELMGWDSKCQYYMGLRYNIDCYSMLY